MGWSISVVFLTLVGCAAKRIPVGTFLGERTLAIVPGTDPVVADQLRRVKLSIEVDGRAILEDGGVSYEGQVSRRDDDLSFEVVAVEGINARKQNPELTRPKSWKIRADGSLEGDGVRLKARS